MTILFLVPFPNSEKFYCFTPPST